jgi:hypothetical protein
VVYSELMARALQPELQTLIDLRRSGHQEERWYRSVEVGGDDGVLYARVHVSASEVPGDLVVRVFAWGLPHTFSDLPTDGVHARSEAAPPWGHVGRDPDRFGERIGRHLREWFGGRELDPAHLAPGPADDRPPAPRGLIGRLRTALSGASPEAGEPAPVAGPPAFGVFAVPLDPAPGS